MKRAVLITLPDGEVKNTFLPEKVLQYLEENFIVTYNSLDRRFTPDEYKELAKSVDYIIGGWGSPMLDSYILDGNDRLKMIAYTTGSVADFTSLEVWEKGIKVSSANDIFAESVAEGTVVYALLGLRGIYDEISRVRNGGWRASPEVFSRGLLRKTVGLIGCGAISKHVMRLLQPFGCCFKVYAEYDVDPDYLKSVNATQVGLEEVLSTCDIVSLHMSLTPESTGFLRKEHFEMLKENAVFVNTARGAIVCESEMIEVLSERHDIKAVLDVFEKEPMDENNPLRKLENVYSLPHRAGPTLDLREYIGRCMVDELLRHSKGEKLQFEITKEAASRMTVHKK